MNSKEKEADIAAAAEAKAFKNARTEFFSSVGSFDYDILTNIEVNTGKKGALVGAGHLYSVHVYEYKGETKGALKFKYLLFADGVRYGKINSFKLN